MRTNVKNIVNMILCIALLCVISVFALPASAASGDALMEQEQILQLVNMERTNIRYVTPDMLEETPSLCVIDVSFISLKIVLPAIQKLLKPTGQVLCLIKPQFEAGREKVGKKGVVRDPKVHLEVLEGFLVHAKENNFTVLGITYSPIRGPEGNIEYLGYLKKGGEADCVPDLRALVDASHSALKEGHGEI